MRPRGCLKIFGIFFVLLIVCCLVGIFVGGPRLQENIADSIGDTISTEVAQQIDIPNLEDRPYTLDVAELEQRLQSDVNGQNVDNVEISVSPDQADASRGTIRIVMTSQEQEIGYTGTVFAEDGKLRIADLDATSGFLRWFLPGDKLASGIEDGVNTVFSEQEKQIESLTVEEDRIVVNVGPLETAGE